MRGSFCSEEECVKRAGTSEALVLIVEDELTRVTRGRACADTATVIVLARRGVRHDPRLTRVSREAPPPAAPPGEVPDPASVPAAEPAEPGALAGRHLHVVLPGESL